MRLPGWALWLSLALGLALARFWTIPTPRAEGPNAPATAFSAARAFPVIKQLAVAAHPIGSIAHDRVRDGLLARMTALGLSPQVERGIGVERGRHVSGDVYAGRVENLIGVLPGQDRAAPALLLMAHYDSVPLSPGAADDMTGVASLLETVRALKASGPHRRDVIVAITDGEEAGMLGAELFFRENPLAARVGAVINAEARGDAGRVAMFETGPGNAGMIRVFARSAERPFGNSLTGFIYALLPNDTDFTLAKRRGLPGLNFAFIGDQLAYHTALSTPEHLDRGSLQHMGGQILGVARALADAPALPKPTTDVVYTDSLPGLPMLVYPPWGGWVVILVGALLLTVGALLGRDRPRIWSMAGGVGAALGATVLAGVVLVVAGLAIGAGMTDVLRLYRLLGPYVPLFAGEALLAFAAVLAVYWLARRLDPLAAWIGAVKLGLVLAVVVQVLAPAAAVLFAWPALVGALSLVVGRFGGRPGLWLSGALAALMFAFLAAWTTQVYAALGPPMPVLLALFVPLLLPTFAAFVGSWSRAPGSVAAAVILAVVGVGLVAWADLWPPTNARPALTRANLYAEPATGLFAWVTPRLDRWTKVVLASGSGRPVRAALPPMFDQPVWRAPVRPWGAVPPEVSVAPGAAGRVRVAARATGGRTLSILVRSPAVIDGAILDGLDVPLKAKAGAWAEVVMDNPGGQPLTLDLAAPASLQAVVVETYEGWPAAVSVPPRPRRLMGSTRSDVTYVVARAPSARP